MLVMLLKTVLAWSVIFPVVFLIGYRLRVLVVRLEDRVLEGIVYCALGMTCLSFAVVVLGSLHVLSAPVIWILLLLCLGLGMRSLPVCWSWAKTMVSDWLFVRTWPDRILSIVFCISLFALLSGVLTPEIGGDALTYQLNLPKIFLSTGGVQLNEMDINSYFPLFLNHLYLIGLAAGGVSAAKLFHFFCGLLLVMLLKRLIVCQSGNVTLATFVALAVWLTPAVNNLLSTTYVDMGLTLYVFLAVWMLVTAFENWERKTFFLSGLFASCAVSVKFLGSLFVLAMLGVWIFEILMRKKCRASGMRFGIWVLGGAVGSLYWVVRNWVAVGNPVYPYLGSIFGTDTRIATPFGGLGLHGSIWKFLLIPWNLYVHPLVFGTYGDRLGVWFFLFMPFFLIGAVVAHPARGYFWFVMLSLVLWYQVAQLSRYLIPVLPAMAFVSTLGVSWVATRLRTSMKFVFGIVGLGFLTTYLMASVYHYRYTYLLLIGWWSPKEYLEKMERTIPIARWINAQLPKTAKLLTESEARQFYIDRPIVRDIALKKLRRYEEEPWTLTSFVEFLKGEGITHILLRDDMSLSGGSEPNTLLRKITESQYSSLIYSVSSQNIWDTRYLYRLYELT